ncbi:hypothetical protein ABL78_3072 [Leptomonas seymouri]|uniref:Uncharacterized protein n=1 Tax=Leptomonas seymouri TaxID=5684 RepID=A0A0N1I012_LEPSE|nr:hypothetical protein ABL78_3072 [Leptomonas seymouri]|eukprot:KPI87845.1 hypothetical protein ABL78_3072 [Leptomonas seymouri]
MGNCCGSASDMAGATPLDTPQRGRHGNALPSSCTPHQRNNAKPQKLGNHDSQKNNKGQRDLPTAPGKPDAHARHSSGHNGIRSEPSGITIGCMPTRTATAAGTAAHTNLSAGTVPVFSQFRSRTCEGTDVFLSDVFNVSESSSSTSAVDLDALSTSFVDVSQATLPARHHHDRTYSEIDTTSDGGERSMDCATRRRSQSRATDRSRLHRLLNSEAEVRASLTQMYLAQHRRTLLCFVKEQGVLQMIIKRREFLDAHTSLCLCWLLACERAGRASVAREWWVERTLLAQRAAAGTVVTSDPFTEASDGAKHEDSAMHFTSNTGREEEVLSSNELTEEGEEHVGARSPSVRFAASAAATVAETSRKAHSMPCASRLFMADNSDTRSSSVFVAARRSVSSPHLQPQSRGAVRRVASAQHAFRDRLPHMQKLHTPVGDNL